MHPGEEKPKKARSEAQKAANAKALAALKEKREQRAAEMMVSKKKELDEAEEMLIQKVVSRLSEAKPKHVEEEPKPKPKKILKEILVEEEEEPKPKPKKIVKKVYVEEEDEEEESVQKVMRRPKQLEEPPAKAPARVSTGNKLLDRLYGII